LKFLALLPLAAAASVSATPVAFESFEYTGRDAAFSAPLAPGHFRNPIFAGFYPDPDICRVGDDYYTVNSSFAYFPGIPVFHSRDLVNWRQVGNVIDRPGQLDYRGLGVSRGIFAPALSHHGGLFYLICTFVDAGGNFLMTARDPAGPWSDPTWLGFDGIDPSLFFDNDGRAWIVNNGSPPDDKPLYSGHRAIWIQEFDPAAMKLFGPREVIVNGGVSLADHPVWVEGPHLFRKDGWYYLLCAEGGTAEQHSEVIFRSRSVHGPFVPGPRNPILTQRTLPDTRPDPVTCTGHADLVETKEGGWWAVFLGCRPYEGTTFNTGRETFMLPVTWSGGWPSILAAGTPVPYSVPSYQGTSADPEPSTPLTGNFTWRDDFRGPALSSPWIGIRGIPGLTFGPAVFVRGLLLTPGKDTLWGNGRPAFVGRRIQHSRFTASTYLEVPASRNISAGLVVFQNENHHYFFGIHQTEQGLEVFVERLNGGSPEKIASFAEEETTRIKLQVACDGATCDFGYSTTPGAWRTLLSGADATQLSTRVAGGFVGAVVGLHARVDP
jgi:alpha-N-arabinofuranosidase